MRSLKISRNKFQQMKSFFANVNNEESKNKTKDKGFKIIILISLEHLKKLSQLI